MSFKRGVLNCGTDEYRPDWDWASLSNVDVGLILSVPNRHLPFERNGFTGSLYFKTQNVDGLWEDLQGKSNVYYGIEDFPYGMREFAIFNNNGYILQFGSPISDAGCKSET